MSQTTIPTIAELSTALTNARTEDLSLALRRDTLPEAIPVASLLQLVRLDALLLSNVAISSTADSLSVSGRVSLLALTDLEVTLQIKRPSDGIELSLRATLGDGRTLDLQGLPALPVGGVSVALDVGLVAGKRTWGGTLSGSLQLGGVTVPVSIRLPLSPAGLVVRGVFPEGQQPGLSVLASVVNGLDLGPQIPAALADVFRLADFELVLQESPFASFTIVAPPWNLLPGVVAMQDLALHIVAVLPTPSSPAAVSLSLQAMLDVGSLWIPIALERLDGGGWLLRLDGGAVPFPGIADLAQLLGGTQVLDTLFPGLASIGGVTLRGLQVQLALSPPSITSLSLAIGTSTPWTLPGLNGLALRDAAVSLRISQPLSSSRAVTGSVGGTLLIGGQAYSLGGDKHQAGAPWQLSGRQLEEDPLSLTALAAQLLPTPLPDGVPDLSFVGIEATMTPATGAFSLSARSTSPWRVPLGPTELALANVDLRLQRTVENGAAKVGLQVSGDLAIGGVTCSLALSLPGGFVLSASLPRVGLADVLSTLGGGAILEGLGLPASFFALELRQVTLTVDATAKTASLSGAATGFEAFELQLRRDASGRMGAALALKPQAGIDLQGLLGVPGLGALRLNKLAFVLSSIHDPALRFTSSAFAGVGTVSRGFGFATEVDIAALGVAAIPGLPTAPLAMQARFGRSLTDFTLAAALSGPGGRFVIDAASGLALIDPELRLSPATAEFSVAGKLAVILDGKALDFSGGLRLKDGGAALYASMQGEWSQPFGLSGVVARDLALQLTLPGLPSLKGTLQIGQTTGALTIVPNPAAPVFDMKVANIDLHELLSSVCDPALLNVPAAYRQTLSDMRIDDAQIYMAPRDTKIGDIDCPAGVKVAGKLHAWGLLIDAQVQTVGSGPLKALKAEGLIALPDLGGLLVLKGGVDERGARRAGPYFKLDLTPGHDPVVVIAAGITVLGTEGPAVDIVLNDAGFRAVFSGQLMGGMLGARLEVTGGRLGPKTKYALAAELDATAISAMLSRTGAQLSGAATDAGTEIQRARELLTEVEKKGTQLSADAAQQRANIEKERADQAQKLRDAQAELQRTSARVDSLLREIASARATVHAERAELNRRIDSARNDVNAAAGRVNALSGEINGTASWFYSLPRIAVPWRPSQAREGAWFGIKMGGLYAARETALGVLNLANRTLQGVVDAQAQIPVDADPRVAGLLGSHATAQVALTAAQRTVALAQSSVSLLPVDADFRLVALRGLQEAQTVQLIAAQSALALAESALKGIASLGASLAPSVTIRRAYFAGELSILTGGSVRLGLEIQTPQGVSTFAVDCNLRDPFACVPQIVSRLLGVDHQRAMTAVQKSTMTAAGTVVQVEQEVLPTNAIVILRSFSNGQLVRALGKNLLRYGDTISLRAFRGQYVVAEDTGIVNANRTAIGAWERFVLSNPYDATSRDFVRYGDEVSLFSYHGRYVVAEQDTRILANRTAVGAWERWVLVLASDPNRRDEVDTSQKIALRSWLGNYLGATDGGGSGTYGHVANLGEYEAFTLIDHNDWSAFNYGLVVHNSEVWDPACQFKLVRSGEWTGFQSEKTGRYLSFSDGKVATASSELFNGDRAWEHFRLESGALWNQRTQSYLRLAGGDATMPQFCDGQGTTRGALTANFGILRAQHLDFMSTHATTGPSTSDLATSSEQKSAVQAGAAAAVGPSAERAAAEQAAALRQSGDVTVAPAQQAADVADAARRDRRKRAIEKAARGLRPTLHDYRDSALRFDGKSYLEAPASRPVLREIKSVADQLRALPDDALINIQSQATHGLVRVIGANSLRYGDTVTFRSPNGSYLVAESDGTINANRPAIGPWEKFVLAKPDALDSRQLVRYGDEICLFSYHGRYLSDVSNVATARQSTIGAAERWSLVAPSDQSRRDEVDLSEGLGLRSPQGSLLIAVNGGGGTTALERAMLFDGNAWRVVGPNWTALDYSLVSQTSDGSVATGADDRSDPACQFRVRKSGEWLGFQSVRSSRYVVVDGSLAVTSSSPSFDAPDRRGEHFAVEDSAIRGQAQERYLRLAASPATGPQLIDSQGREADAAESAFAFLHVEDGSRLTAQTRVDNVATIELGTQFTIDAWICPEALGSTQQAIISKWAQSPEDELLLYLSPEGYLGVAWHLAGSTAWGTPGWNAYQSDQPVKLDTWNHVAVVRDGDSLSLYLDGRRMGGTTGLGTVPMRVGTSRWRIGAEANPGSPRGFVGLIDSIRIWGRALDTAALRAQRFLVSRGDESDLLACWNLDEEAGDLAFDASPRELHAHLIGTVRRASPGAPEGMPLPDRHLTLSGSSHALLGNVDLFGGSTQLTIQSWVRIDRISGDLAALFSKWSQSVEDEILFGVAANGKLIFAWHTAGGTVYGTAGWNHLYSDSSIPFGRYCHVSVVRDNKTIRFYCNGQPIGSSDAADEKPLRHGTVPLCIGSERGALRFLTGSLAELRVFARALSGEEVRTTYTRPLRGDEAQLVGLWQLDEGWGSVVRDSSASARHGQLSGSVTWPALGGPPRHLGPSRGMQFDGGQYIEFADADSFSPSVALTIESWLRIDAISTDFTSIVNKWQQSTDSEYLFGLMPDGRLAFAWHTEGSDVYGTTGFGHVYSVGKIALGQWTHVAVVRAGETVSFYIDGQAAGSSQSCDLKPFRNSTAPLRIGAEAGATGRFLRGTLAGVRSFRTARTPTELAASMSGLVSSRAPGRLLDLRFEEGEGVTVLDAASGRSGRLVGQPAPSFVAVTLPVRSPSVSEIDVADLWLQPALDAATHCRERGLSAAQALPEVETVLAKLETANPTTLIAILAKAGYAAGALATISQSRWSLTPQAITQLFCDADRPAGEALLAGLAALPAETAKPQAKATALASAAGYSGEELGLALLDVWGYEAHGVAKLYREAELDAVAATPAVWANLSRQVHPSFAGIVEILLASGYAQSAVRQALRGYLGVDDASIDRAVLRAGALLTVIADRDYLLREIGHGRCMVAGNVYDQHVYHQDPEGRDNARWHFEPAPGGGFYIRDRKHGKCLVAGDTYDQHVYHQDPQGRDNARWQLVHSIDEGGTDTFFIVDSKHGKALVAGDVADNNLYHQDPQGRRNARFVLSPVS